MVLEHIMNFYDLKSAVTGGKNTFQMQMSSESFYVAPKREKPYIEPTFAKVEFHVERPAVILIEVLPVVKTRFLVL
jgi:hypothetical protein